jgi:hypothetical protein
VHRGRAATANAVVDGTDEKVRWVVKGPRRERRGAAKEMEGEARVALQIRVVLVLVLELVNDLRVERRMVLANAAEMAFIVHTRLKGNKR